MAGGAERQNFELSNNDWRIKKIARNVVLVAGTLGAPLGFVACGQDSKAQTTTPELTHTQGIEPTGTRYPTPTEVRTPTETVKPTEVPIPEITQEPQIEVNQENAAKFLDTDPHRFRLVAGDGRFEPLRVAGGLNRIGWNLEDTTNGELIRTQAQFLELLGETKTKERALAVISTLKEGVMSNDEIEAEIEYAKSQGVDISSQVPSAPNIESDFFDVEVWELNRHSCQGKDSQGRLVYDEDLIKLVTYRVYQPYLPTNPPTLPPGVRDIPVMQVSETQQLQSFPKPACVQTE